MEGIELRLVSPLEKIFPDRPAPEASFSAGSALWGEETAFQAVLRRTGGWGPGEYIWGLETALPGVAQVFRVETVPCDLAAYPEPQGHDEDYLTLQAGLFPDVLEKAEPGKIYLSSHRYTALWVDLTVPEGTPAGSYPFTLWVRGQEACAQATFTLQVVPAALPPQRLLFTQWFHVDCLAEYYQVPVYSEAHWTLIERFLRMAAENGMNTVLTPLLTPPLDTEVGTERTCTQLVEVEQTPAGYRFGFDRLRRFVQLAESCGITHFEVCQLFSQWGAKCAPNIHGTVSGEDRLLFGWDTPADDPAYREFLQQLLPQALTVFTELGVRDRLLFHLSDEPSPAHLEAYAERRAFLRELLGDLPVMDAISDPVFCEQGLIDVPVSATDHIGPFLERGQDPLWAYTCCGQNRDVGNRFLAMPSYRNRVLGLQLYKFRIRGFLQWGYNFWHSWHSLYAIDPYRCTDAGGTFPGGDAFSVYPGPDGQPVASLRLKVFHHALQDLRALELLESRIGRQETEALIEGFDDLQFDRYPANAAYYLDLREKVNRRISASLP